MPCANHPDREQKADCLGCGKALCEACLFYANSDPYCEPCVTALQRAFAAEQASRSRRTVGALLAGAAVSGGGIAGWEWLVSTVKFEGAKDFTFIVMIGIVFGMALIMRRLFGQGNKMLFGVACVFVLGVMLRGEYVLYELEKTEILFRAAEEGLSAEQLLRISENRTYWTHMSEMDPFGYLFILAGVFLTYRRLWPMRSYTLDIIRPSETG